MIRDPVVTPDLSGGRVGEPSRDCRGELTADEAAERYGMVGVVDERFKTTGEEEEGRDLLSLVPEPGPEPGPGT